MNPTRIQKYFLSFVSKFLIHANSPWILAMYSCGHKVQEPFKVWIWNASCELGGDYPLELEGGLLIKLHLDPDWKQVIIWCIGMMIPLGSV